MIIYIDRNKSDWNYMLYLTFVYYSDNLCVYLYTHIYIYIFTYIHIRIIKDIRKSGIISCTSAKNWEWVWSKHHKCACSRKTIWIR